MRHRLPRLEHFAQLLELAPSEHRGLVQASERFAVAVTPHLASLMEVENSNCPIRRQVIPREEELTINPGELVDPCGEDPHAVVEGLVHRSPDRVLLLAMDSCAAYCRYCTRSRLVAQGELDPLPRRLGPILDYLRRHQEIRDVLISGGDPLLMSEERLETLLSALRGIPHMEFLRLGSRVPCFLPQRVSPELVAVLRKHRVWLSLHFSQPRELTPEVARACDLLADGGIPLGSQTVLLKGVNDDAATLRDLLSGLLRMRVRPYYLSQCDPVVGTAHLRTSISQGLNVMGQLRGHISGYAVPTSVVDAPGGGGKIPLQPDTIVSQEGKRWVLRNWAGEEFVYTDPENP